MEVVIIMAKCEKTGKSYGIRVEQVSDFKWNYTWAFPMSDKTAKLEGYDTCSVEGKITIKRSFPGCPHCGASAFFMCECGKISCWDTITNDVTCAWCGTESVIGKSINKIKGGEF